ncbi:MAG: TIGR02147 family protein [Pseudobdellovibrionaceae bacterium]
MSQASTPILSSYMNFRNYLQDYYLYKKKCTENQIRPYNYAVFSAAADIKSPNYLKLIISGKRNLSDDMIAKFARALGFNKDLSIEFTHLVHFCQATDPADRNYFLKKLCEHRFEQKLYSGEIDRKTWDKIPNWIAWILYAMIDQAGVEFDPDQLRQLLKNKASEDEISKALEALVLSGELQKDAVTGRFKKTRSLIESPENVPVDLVRKIQAQLMYLGLESLYEDQPAEREIGTLTLSLTAHEFEELKFKLRQLRKSVHKDNSIARMKGAGEKVYQLNIQLFPVTLAATQTSSTAFSKVSKDIEAVASPSSSDMVAAPAVSETAISAVMVAQQAAESARIAAETKAAPAAAAVAEGMATSVVAAATDTVDAALAVKGAIAPKTTDSKKPENDNSAGSSVVSSLAASAASAADLFR